MKRINYIDIARAFAIIFIVLGHTLVHSSNCKIVFKFLYSFHVMLFFIISGYIFRIKNDEKGIDFVKNKFIRIMIPYFIWSILFLIPYMILGQNVGDTIGINSSFDLKTQILNILYGNGNNSALKQNSSLWFLPALFTMEIIYYFVVKYVNKFKINKIIILIPIILISYITNDIFKIILPWGLNTVLVLGIFFYIGYLFKEYKLLTNKKIFKIKYLFFIFIMGLLAFYFNNIVSCIEYDYGNLTFLLTSGLCLSIIIIYISYLINENKLLQYIGKNTMGILIFHKLVIIIFQTKLGKISLLLLNSNILIEFSLSLIVTIISIIFSLIITQIIKKIIPFIIGEK